MSHNATINILGFGSKRSTRSTETAALAALDLLDQNIMVADADRNIIYSNF